LGFVGKFNKIKNKQINEEQNQAGKSEETSPK